MSRRLFREGAGDNAELLWVEPVDIDYEAAVRATAYLLRRMGGTEYPHNLLAEATAIVDAALASRSTPT